jgi:hypothetical protein
MTAAIPAGWDSLEAAADSDLTAAGRDLDRITAAISEKRLPLIGLTREEAARRIAANLAGPPPSTEGLRRVAAIFGLSVRDVPSAGPRAAA